MCRHNYDASQDGIIILKRLGTINKNKTVERTIFERFRRRRREKIVFFNDQIMIFSGKNEKNTGHDISRTKLIAKGYWFKVNIKSRF